jgi:ribosomal protein S6--L-glutamate ligase
MIGTAGEIHIAFFLERHPSRARDPWVSPVMEGILTSLRERGATVDLMVPEDSVWELSELRPRHDLYVLKSETPLALSLAGALTVAGAQVLNSFHAVNLARSGVPVPPSYTTGKSFLLRPLLEEGPIWVKPQRGTKGAGVRRMALPPELDTQQECLDTYGLPLPFFVQKEFPSSGKDLKVYVVGDRTWATERSFPAITQSQKTGITAPVPHHIREAALACGRVLHLELYGVDFLVSKEGFAVIDVNGFPGYKGVDEAPAALAEYIHRRALAARDGKRGNP